ncbi:hypothetical protein F2Q69_00048659 [Brassica cretica]|uniref:Uncharacterized protein n=1 Tax=Brassica cretica TaxID=69181 RepID=A0A8S9PS45_BRACR|nr:hypothetical protein F2Q69_00048659 [Brassica cretica]
MVVAFFKKMNQKEDKKEEVQSLLICLSALEECGPTKDPTTSTEPLAQPDRPAHQPSNRNRSTRSPDRVTRPARPTHPTRSTRSPTRSPDRVTRPAPPDDPTSKELWSAKK